MYIYELPFIINKELCRLLDNDDDWKELAGIHMKYSPFHINEMEQIATRQAMSPTNQLFITWGQLNHKVEELFILLYRMKHVPALRCLTEVVDNRLKLLLKKLDNNGVNKKPRVGSDDNSNRSTQKVESSDRSIPLPVKYIEKGVQLPTSSKLHVHLGTNDSTNESSKVSTTNSTQCSKGNDMNNELIRSIDGIPMLSYEAVKEATDNWSESNLLGRGGFGKVFKGVWKLTPVAVKQLKENDDHNRELIRELCLNKYRHDNILPLYGYSIGGPEACLVYQLMGGGSLEQRLRCKTQHPPLSWPQRYRVAHGVARGLQFLHTMAGIPLIHGDIKPANILLDQCTMPKIGDFGLARTGPYGEDRTHLKVSRVHGTRPYLPDEYLRSRCLSPAVDVFSYGVVAIELASALPVQDRARYAPDDQLADYMRRHLNNGIDFASLEDRVLRGTQFSSPELCRQFIAIGLHCTKYARQERPTMLDVYKRLDAMDVPGKIYP